MRVSNDSKDSKTRKTQLNSARLPSVLDSYNNCTICITMKCASESPPRSSFDPRERKAGGERRKSRQRGRRGDRQVFRLPELTKSLWREWKNYCLSPLKSLSQSLHENLSINQKIYEFRIRNEELSLSLS